MNEDLQRFWIRLTADRRKFSAMCALAAVGLLLWARLLLLHDVPRTGLAEPIPAAEGATASTSETNEPRKVDRPSIESAPVVYLDASTQLARNIFAAPKSMFPQTEQAASVDDVTPKSQTDTPEDPVEAEHLRVAAIEGQASKLHLDSLILGNAPAAVINNRVVRQGGRVDGFVLERVLKRSVILTKDRVRVELKMDTPG